MSNVAQHSGVDVVIATLDRPDWLERTLRSLAIQSPSPDQVIVIDASAGGDTAALCNRFQGPFTVIHQSARRRSAADQRNQGAALAKGELLWFVDDDVELPTDTLAKLMESLNNDPGLAGVSARENGMAHPVPSPWLRRYYRLQAGYDHLHYGGKLFGPAINCVPAYLPGEGPLIPGDWLPSTCVLYRRELFARVGFPDFVEYSWMEDVALSAQIHGLGRLAFRADAPFEHFHVTSSFKRDALALGRMRIRHQRHIARRIMGQSAVTVAGKLLLHRLFVTVFILRQHGSWREIAGLWTG